MVRLFGLRESHALLSELSTTAMHNLLVLVELNVQMLPSEDVKRFIDSIKDLSFVNHDEWTRYLIQRLKRHFLDTNKDQPFAFMERDLIRSPSLPDVDEPMEQDNHEAAEGSPDIITISDSEADNPDALSRPLRDPEAGSHRSSPHVESHVEHANTAAPLEENGEVSGCSPVYVQLYHHDNYEQKINDRV